MDGYMQVFTQLSGNNCITVCYYTAHSSVPYCNPKNYFKRYKESDSDFIHFYKTGSLFETTGVTHLVVIKKCQGKHCYFV